jgi:uncharacterized protein YkwD
MPMALAAVVLAALALAGSGHGAQRDPLLAPVALCGNPATSEPVETQLEAMICMHDYARRQAGAERLETVTTLSLSASVKAGWIRDCGSFSHRPCGHSFVSAFQAVGYDRGAWRVGENLAWGAGEWGRVRTIFRAWLDSPTHRSNIVRTEWRELGLTMSRSSRLFGARAVVLWVVHFGLQRIPSRAIARSTAVAAGSF